MTYEINKVTDNMVRLPVYIEENAGFNDLEMMVYELRCMGMSFTSIADEIDYHPRYCKTIASRIREKIAYLIH